MKVYTFGMYEYGGRLVEVKIIAEDMPEALRKARLITENCREVFDIDEGIHLNDVEEYKEA